MLLRLPLPIRGQMDNLLDSFQRVGDTRASITKSTTLDREEVLEILARPEGCLYRPVEWDQEDAVPEDVRYVGPAPTMYSSPEYVFERSPSTGQRFIVRGRWGVPGDQIACGERYRPGGASSVEYEADCEPDARPLTGYWKPAKQLPDRLTRIILQVVDVEPCRLHDAAARTGRLPQDGLRDLWNRKFGRWGFEWTSNPWVWAVRYIRLEPP